MKTLNLEICKRLEEHLKDVRTEYFWHNVKNDWIWDWEHQDEEQLTIVNEMSICWKIATDRWDKMKFNFTRFKAPTLEEALDLLPSEIKLWKLLISKDERLYMIGYWHYHIDECANLLNISFFEPTSLEAVEKMLDYLITNDLLWIKK